MWSRKETWISTESKTAKIPSKDIINHFHLLFPIERCHQQFIFITYVDEDQELSIFLFCFDCPACACAN